MFDKTRLLKSLGLGLLAAAVVIQFFRIDKTNPDVDQDSTFIAEFEPPQDVTEILKTSCYDCHSNETEYPWYTNVAPISWWIKDHIDHGREELNLSIWSTYSDRRKAHKLEEIIEYVESDEMPLPSYLWAHSEARLSPQQKEVLTGWVRRHVPSKAD